MEETTGAETYRLCILDSKVALVGVENAGFSDGVVFAHCAGRGHARVERVLPVGVDCSFFSGGEDLLKKGRSSTLSHLTTPIFRLI